jgi:hypothetical protein
VHIRKATQPKVHTILEIAENKKALYHFLFSEPNTGLSNRSVTFKVRPASMDSEEFITCPNIAGPKLAQ